MVMQSKKHSIVVLQDNARSVIVFGLADTGLKLTVFAQGFLRPGSLL
jgi:hypothetical protein